MYSCSNRVIASHRAASISCLAQFPSSTSSNRSFVPTPLFVCIFIGSFSDFLAELAADRCYATSWASDGQLNPAFLDLTHLGQIGEGEKQDLFSGHGADVM